MAKKKKSSYAYLYIILIVAIVVLLALIILNEPTENLPDNMTNETLAYAKGCWCPGAIADYWEPNCDCAVQEAVNVIEKDR